MFILAMDWSPYFGGWDMNGLLAACAAGAAPMVAVVVIRVGAFFGFRLLRWVVEFFGWLGRA